MVPKNVHPLSVSAGTRVNIHSSHFNFPDITQAFHIFSLLLKIEIRKEKGMWFPFET